MLVHVHVYVLSLSLSLSLSQDAAFEFEKKRNVPLKYDRKLWQRTGTHEIQHHTPASYSVLRMA